VAYSTPAKIFTAEGLPADASDLRLRTELLTPPHDWIDLYFHVEGGRWSSPHIPDEAAPWTVECTVTTESAQQYRDDLAWLEGNLDIPDLHDRVTEALTDDLASDESPEASAAGVVVVYRASRPAVPNTAASAEFEKRRDSHRASQRSYLPAGECVPAYDLPSGEGASGDPDGERDGSAVSVESKPNEFIAPFWLDGPKPGEDPKLVFVREGTSRDGGVFYQGFVADWTTLRRRLLRQIDHLFEQAALVPITDDEEQQAAAAETRMAALPVYLDVPDVAGGVNAAAWRSLRAKLVLVWMGAAAVLVVAGWGLWNLVNLTERRSQFAYSVTHELRTPLTTFRLYSDMLAAGLVPDDSKQEYVDTLNREAIRLSSLVEGVLEYARLENHRVRLNVVDTDAPALLQSIRETLEKRCADNGITARTENAVANGQRLRTDVDVVQRIAAVLVNNACRHARSAKDPIVKVRLGRENGAVYLDVIDSGPGIDRGDVRRIFKPFRRGKGADAAAQGGIGLGLSLARSWAKLLGGQLELHARHDPDCGGAHFRLTIPSEQEN
jgi:signal transduction histidine kinase